MSQELEQERIPPPWVGDLRTALSIARRAIRTDARSADWVEAAIEAAERSGWDGDREEFWRVAGLMAELEGSLPQHPQQAFLRREVDRFWGMAG